MLNAPNNAATWIKKILALAERETEVREQKVTLWFTELGTSKQTDGKAVIAVTRIKTRHLIHNLWTTSSWSSVLVTTWAQMTLKDEKAHFKIPANQ